MRAPPLAGVLRARARRACRHAPGLRQEPPLPARARRRRRPERCHGTQHTPLLSFVFLSSALLSPSLLFSPPLLSFPPLFSPLLFPSSHISSPLPSKESWSRPPHVDTGRGEERSSPLLLFSQL